ncbi:MAG: CehA/McbA family metallohydrolase [Planctomycetes bacterium]|nr:CehA/McbA family metallohydrolase [Planctomycetota bacterium]
MNAAEKAKLAQRRFERIVQSVGYVKRDLALRLSETKKLFGRKVYAVDPHTHSNYSDGRGTVDENTDCFHNAGLDFYFATDHNSLKQKKVVRKWSDVSWGQEPGGDGHHIGLLCGTRLFKPRRDNIAADFARAKEIAPFAWIPHPIGWYPVRWYDDERIESLWTLGDEFAIEVMNGANKVFRAYDAFDAKAVTVWDRLLCDGRKVTALGASDAHCPDDIGSAWTGIFAAKRTAPSLIKALNAGRCFASESALIDFTCNGRPIGSTLTKRKGAKLDLRFRVADAGGLASVSIVSQGKVIKKIAAAGKTLVDASLTRKAPAGAAYYRVESVSSDDRRAFSTPIYVRPAGA